MKKIFLVLITLILLTTQTFARSGWATALVDAGGAWGGATSGAPYFPPYGAIIGGVLCGAAASLALCCGGQPQNYPINSVAILNTNNTLEEVGINHNLLVSQFIQQGLDRSNTSTIVSNLFNLTKANNFDTKEFTEEFILNQTNALLNKDLTNIEGIYNLISQSIPISTHSTVHQALLKIDATANIEDFSRVSVEEENKILAIVELNETQKISFKAFFSTLRHSASYWGKN